jgi:hypothetical protein
MNRLDIDDDLDRLGDALRAATTIDLAHGDAPSAGGRRAPWRRPRVIGAVLVAAAAAIPAGAAVAGAFDSPQQVAQSMPAGIAALKNSDPTCTVVTTGVQYHCTLAHPPQGDLGAGHWNRTVEETVNPSTNIVNGGCRSQNAAGTDWLCYLGQEAVTQKIIGQDFLGTHVDGPGRG